MASRSSLFLTLSFACSAACGGDDFESGLFDPSAVGQGGQAGAAGSAGSPAGGKAGAGGSGQAGDSGGGKGGQPGAGQGGAGSAGKGTAGGGAGSGQGGAGSGSSGAGSGGSPAGQGGAGSDNGGAAGSTTAGSGGAGAGGVAQGGAGSGQAGSSAGGTGQGGSVGGAGQGGSAAGSGQGGAGSGGSGSGGAGAGGAGGAISGAGSGGAGSGGAGAGGAGSGGAGSGGAGSGGAGAGGAGSGGAGAGGAGSGGAGSGGQGGGGSGQAGFCSDGTTDIANGEECDDGNLTNNDGCDDKCQFEVIGQTCGDNAKNGVEKCDDGNKTNGDACNPTCNLTNTTSLFAGTPGSMGPPKDGIGPAAVLSGTGTLIATDAYLYLAESGSWLIRRIDAQTAEVKTIAGSGMQGSTDHPTNPLLASFSGQGGLATDGTTLWISDGRRLREMKLDGSAGVKTVAGSGQQGCSDGFGGAATLNDTRALAYHQGLIYMVDASCNTLRRYNPATGEVKTLAGSGIAASIDGVGLLAQFNSPRYLAADQAGTLFIADTNGNRLRSYDIASAQVTTVAGGQCGIVDAAGGQARFNRLRGLTTDGTSVYVGEQNGHVIRQIEIASKSVTTLVGTPPSCTINCSCPNPGPPPAGAYNEGVGVAALFNNPFNLAFHYPSSSLFVLDANNRVIRRIQ